ncbi:hypothetical protein ACKKBG_A06820 [Auxenochlorella protothecoides x Auxenochlorella symbiontica]
MSAWLQGAGLQRAQPDQNPGKENVAPNSTRSTFPRSPQPFLGNEGMETRKAAPCEVLQSFASTMAAFSDVEASWLATPDPWLDEGVRARSASPAASCASSTSQSFAWLREEPAWPMDTLESLSPHLPELPAHTQEPPAQFPELPAHLLETPIIRPRPVRPYSASPMTARFLPRLKTRPGAGPAVVEASPSLLETAVRAALQQLAPEPRGIWARQAASLLEWLQASVTLARPGVGCVCGGSPPTPPSPSVYGTPCGSFMGNQALLEEEDDDLVMTPLLRAIACRDEAEYLTAA